MLQNLDWLRNETGSYDQDIAAAVFLVTLGASVALGMATTSYAAQLEQFPELMTLLCRLELMVHEDPETRSANHFIILLEQLMQVIISLSVETTGCNVIWTSSTTSSLEHLGFAQSPV